MTGIKFKIDAKGLERKLMEAAKKKYANAARAMSCPEHHKHPSVTFVGEKMELSCCCDAFRDSVVEKLGFKNTAH